MKRGWNLIYLNNFNFNFHEIFFFFKHFFLSELKQFNQYFNAEQHFKYYRTDSKLEFPMEMLSFKYTIFRKSHVFTHKRDLSSVPLNFNPKQAQITITVILQLPKITQIFMKIRMFDRKIRNSTYGSNLGKMSTDYILKPMKFTQIPIIICHCNHDSLII